MRTSPIRTSVAAFVTVLLLSACGSEDGASSSDSTVAPTLPQTTTATTATTTSSAAPTTTQTPTTTSTAPPTPLEELTALGYSLSDDWQVDNVVVGLDSGTGGLAVAADGTLYQADFGYRDHPGNTLYRIAPDGTIEAFSMSDDFGSLTATVIGPDGTIYQSSYGTDKVFAIDANGTARVVAEGIAGPTGIVVLEDGTLFVEAYDSRRLHRVDPDGTVSEFARDRGFNGPNGLTRGPDGTLYVANHRNGGLFSVDQEGTVTELHQFPTTTAHVVYLDGSLFVTGRGTYVIYRYDLATGDVEIIAGNGEPGDAEGIGTEASFGRPNAIAAGPDGALYINHGDGSSNNPVHIKRISRRP